MCGCRSLFCPEPSVPLLETFVSRCLIGYTRKTSDGAESNKVQLASITPDRMGLPFDGLLELWPLIETTSPVDTIAFKAICCRRMARRGLSKNTQSHMSQQGWPAHFVGRLKGFSDVAQWVRAPRVSLRHRCTTESNECLLTRQRKGQIFSSIVTYFN